MQIKFSPINNNYPEYKKNRRLYPNLSPLPYDTVTFGALKKSKFDGVELAVIEKYKAPIEKFNTVDDMQTWAGKQVERIVKTDFGGRQRETKIQRKAMLKEWSDYVTKENGNYTPAMQLLILGAVTSGLKPNEDKLPPVLNKGVLADVMDNLQKELKTNPKQQFNLNKIYQTKLSALYLETTDTGVKSTGWVVIPSKKHDSDNFEANVDKLKTLSHKNWCTKSFNAEPYLSEGDFHVYLENGNPKLGVRFVGDKIQEIQGELNNGKIPVSYFDEVKKHIDDNQLELHSNAKEEIETAEKAKIKIDKVKTDLKDAIEENDVKTILEYFKSNCEELPDGMLKIDGYFPPHDYAYRDIGVDENKLFQKIKEITGKADFKNSQVTSLGKLERIGRYVDFRDSQITDLGNLKHIGGDAGFRRTQITDLGNLESIGGSVDFEGTPVINLGNLKSVGRYASFSNSQITDLGNLEIIGGNANFTHSRITDLGKLERIGGSVEFEGTQVINLGNLKSVGGDAYFEYSKITDLGNLESIGGKTDFRYSQITNLGKLESIGGNANFENSQITDLGNLKSIGGNAAFYKSKITDLGSLKHIGGDAVFYESPITDLGKLECIGGDADFFNSRITNLGILQSIGGDAYFRESLITDLGNLQRIEGSAYFGESKMTSLGKLESIGAFAAFQDSRITDLGKLQHIGGNACIENSRLKEEDFANIYVGGRIFK